MLLNVLIYVIIDGLSYENCDERCFGSLLTHLMDVIIEITDMYSNFEFNKVFW